jgi:hypothetical protein
MSFLYDEGTDGLSQHCNLKQVQVTWTSDGSGNASGTCRKIVGKLVKAIVGPGSPTPTNGYSIVITDGNSVNVLGNVKADLSSNGTSTAETYFFIKDTSGTPVTQAVFPVVCDQLTFTIAAAGNAKQGSVVLHFQTL